VALSQTELSSLLGQVAGIGEGTKIWSSGYYLTSQPILMHVEPEQLRMVQLLLEQSSSSNLPQVVLQIDYVQLGPSQGLL
jgi:hypothetical protein